MASGAILFSSNNKYNAGSGWPSFTKKLEGAPIDISEVTGDDGVVRKEIHCSVDGVNLGFLFDDGPQFNGGFRYSIKGTCLSFIPKERLSDDEKKLFGFSEQDMVDDTERIHFTTKDIEDDKNFKKSDLNMMKEMTFTSTESHKDDELYRSYMTPYQF